MKHEKSLLLEVIGDSTENRIIDFLIEGKGLDYSKSDIAEGCSISRPTVYKLLPKLVKEGVVKQKRTIGRIALFELNKDNEKATILLKLEGVLLKKSFEELEEKQVSVVKAKR